MNDTEVAKSFACEQFIRRRRYAVEIEKVDNAGLHAGSPMYFYCKHCGIPTEVLPEDFLFPPSLTCSQCKGLEDHHWLKDAVELADKEGI